MSKYEITKSQSLAEYWGLWFSYKNIAISAAVIALVPVLSRRMNAEYGSNSKREAIFYLYASI